MQRRQKMAILLNELKRTQQNADQNTKKIAKHARKRTDNNLYIFVSLRTHRSTK